MREVRRVRVRYFSLTRWRVVTIAAVWWLTAPIANVKFYDEELRRGSFPPESDSIMIGIVGYTVAWLAVTPMLALLLWWAGRRAAAVFSWTTWDPTSPLRMGVALMISVALLIAGGQGVVYGVQGDHLADVARGMLGIVFAFALRALISAPRTPPASHAGQAPRVTQKAI